MKSPLKILLIDDRVTESLQLNQLIEQRKNSTLEIVGIADSRTALSIWKNNNFDGVILKHNSSELDTVNLIRQLQKVKMFVPIVVVFDGSNESLGSVVIEAGAYDYFDESQITSVIIEKSFRQAIRTYKAEAQTRRSNRKLKSRERLLRKKNNELKRQKQKIKSQALQLEKAYQLKSQFLSTLSHELRTPMNAIIGFSQLLLRNYPDPLTSNQTDMLERIYGNSQNLLTMIDEVLDFSEIETGKIDFKIEKFNLSHLIASTVDEIRPLAAQKNLTLDIELNLNDPMVENDCFFYRSILINLLSNAVKFTFEGGIFVKVWELDMNRIAIAVKDTGIGITQESLETVFKPFRQVDQTITREYSGTGLGLAIVNSLTKKMKGTVTVKSTLNQGSIFQVEIPRYVYIHS